MVGPLLEASNGAKFKDISICFCADQKTYF